MNERFEQISAQGELLTNITAFFRSKSETVAFC
jgi:hypothetical protein